MRIFEVGKLRDRISVFRNRTHAGEVLASLLQSHGETESMVLAIPAGGVPIAMVIAHRLGNAFDLLTVSKITLQWNTEMGFGAVAYDGSFDLNESLISALGLTPDQVQQGISLTREKVERRMSLLRGSKRPPEAIGKSVILVDDGLASGFTMMVAVQAVRRLKAARVVVAVPTGHEDAVQRLAVLTETVYCANIRSSKPFAVADAYENWYDVTDQELIDILNRNEPIQRHKDHKERPQD